MRKGSLTDEQTLAMYEDGVNVIVICLHEGMTVYGVLGRLGRARKARRATYPKRVFAPKQPSQLVNSMKSLREALVGLETIMRSL